MIQMATDHLANRGTVDSTLRESSTPTPVGLRVAATLAWVTRPRAPSAVAGMSIGAWQLLLDHRGDAALRAPFATLSVWLTCAAKSPSYIDRTGRQHWFDTCERRSTI